MPKQKQYECRKCGLVTQQKVEYWQHIPVHYKPEKLLVCNACEFVTVYKHHFEYHQRNHAGYKPFKCDMCDYECVNKSMLNSHLKSHSTIYDYKCGECRYATKYVHSLKVHMQKYKHRPECESSVELINGRRSSKSSVDNSPMSSLSPEHDQNGILDLRIGSKQQQERPQIPN